MKQALFAAVVALALSPAVFAAETKGDKEPTAQQMRMKECNQKAGDKKGDERKRFMSTCLKGKRDLQQNRMTACNKEATGKKGEERKAFMKSCLANKS